MLIFVLYEHTLGSFCLYLQIYWVTMGIIERIKEIEAEMARTQKNKATG